MDKVKHFRESWAKLKGRIDDERHTRVLAKLDEQLRHAGLWRDRINLFFFQLSEVPDARNRIRSDHRLSPK